MSDLQDQIKRMGFDAVMAENLSEIVRITRETTIEECAKVCHELRRADYSAETEDWIVGTADCARALRALVSSTKLTGE